MAHKTLYRVYRPAVFGDVVGQRHITDILKKQVENGSPSHAYLFYGPRGTGKTSTARIFANALNCLSPKNGDPCHECEVCKSFEKDAFIDIVEIDAASNNGVDNVRDIREKVSLLPAQGKYKIYIIDEVHMLSAGAWGALLKTLEEPPPHAVFILATTEIRKVPATILSRCQRYDFKRITDADILARLEYVAGESGVEYEPEALELIARQAEGAMRDALSILEQCMAGGGKLTGEAVVKTVGIADAQEIFALAQAVMGENPGTALEVTNRMLQSGISAHNILRDLISALAEELAAHARDAYQCANILRSLEALISSQTALRYAGVPDAVLIAAVARASTNTTDIDTEDMELRLKKLELRVEKMAEDKKAMPDNQAAQPAPKPAQKPNEEPAQKAMPPVEAIMPEEEDLELARMRPEKPPRMPAPGPEKPVQPEGAELEQARVQPEKMPPEESKQKLQQLKDEILRQNMLLYPAIDAVQGLSVHGGKLVLCVPEEDESLAEMLMSEANRADVEAVVQKVFGQELKVALARAEVEKPPPADDIARELIAAFGEDNVEIVE